jgi:glycosyltransferase involved in cell wall biosynthesis
VNAETLDVLHLPAPIDIDVCPDGQFDCRRVATFFDAIPLAMPDQFLNRWPEILQVHYKRQVATYRKADVVVAISEASRRDAIRLLGLPPEKVTTVHCGARPRSHSSGDDELARRILARFGVTGPFFVFCSVCDFHKNWEGMLEAYRAARTDGLATQLVMVSARDDAHFPRVEKVRRQLGLSDTDVIVTGRVTDHELSVLYSSALALISPAFYEGFGLPALEAMAVGTPVIAADRTSLPEVVGDAGLFFDPSDPAALSAIMKEFAAQPQLRARLSAKCAARAAFFSVERQANALLAVYRGERIAVAPTGMPEQTLPGHRPDEEMRCRQ